MRTNGFYYEYSYAAKTDPGKVRQANQDAVVCCPEQGFFAVIDGMGGLPRGGETTGILERILPALAIRLKETLPDDCTPELAGEALSKAIAGVSDNLYEQTNTDGNIGFGAALCALLLVDHCAVLVHLGDCRCYWMGWGTAAMTRLTTDHNVAAEMVAAGLLKSDCARRSPYSARLTKFVGMRAPAGPEATYKRLSKDDRLMLCSDGLHGELEEQDIAEEMKTGLTTAEFCETMIANANEHGGRDNISLIMISFNGGE